jgi:hypothetical protein
MSTQSAAALTRSAKPKLKDPAAPVVMPTPAELLSRKKEELAKLREQHKAATDAHRADSVNEHGFAKQSSALNPALEAKKLEIQHQIERAEAELGLLVELAKRDRAESPEVKTEADALVRQRALALISLRKINAAIERLNIEGADIPVYLGCHPGGMTAWGNMLLGHSKNHGVNGKAAAGYLGEVFNAGLISRAELAEDD